MTDPSEKNPWHACRLGFFTSCPRELPGEPVSTADNVISDDGDNVITDQGEEVVPDP